jgi:hypothetical protein
MLRVMVVEISFGKDSRNMAHSGSRSDDEMKKPKKKAAKKKAAKKKAAKKKSTKKK